MRNLNYYLDIAFLVNFFMDYLLLWLVKVFRNRPSKNIRLAASAAFGALCSCIPVFSRLSGAAAILYLFSCAAVMCIIAFGKRRNAFLKNYTSLLFFTFVMGGMIYSFGVAFMGQWGVQGRQLLITSFWLVLFTVFAVLLFFLVRFLRTEEKKRLEYPVKLSVFGQEFSCQGFMDTGNCLYEPFYGKPVVLITDKTIYQVMQDGILQKPEAARFVLFRSVGKKQGILAGTELTELIIQMEDGEIRQKNVVAVYAGSGMEGKGYQVILHPDLIKS